MTFKGCFENEYEDYTSELFTEGSITQTLQKKLSNFQSLKFNTLLNKMRKDIFYDGTVYTGSAGLALYYFMSACAKNEVDERNDMLKTGLEFLNVDTLKGRRISFLCGDGGPLALATVISYKLGTNRPESLADYKTLAHRLMSLVSLLEDSPDELLYGKSGYLYSLLFVNKDICGKETIPSSLIEKVVQSILKSGKKLSTQMKSDSPLLWQWHDKIYFGAAHGMAGILFMLLQARQYIDKTEMHSSIKPTLDWLLNHQYPSGNFPSSHGSSSHDRLIQWCHGAPGFVPLCILANQVFEEDKYMKIALNCGDVIWQRGLSTKGYSICHGVSGNAYAFIQLYQTTKNPIHLYRACCFTDWCAEERPGTELHRPDRPASLFEGLVGRLYLAQDITKTFEAKFPAFCL